MRFAKKASILGNVCIVLLGIVLISLVSVPRSADAAQRYQGLSEAQLGEFAQNGILFYDPGECIGGSSGSGTLCGSTAREKYWSALSQYTDDPIKVAGILGNLAAEGNFQPVLWEYSITNSDGTLTYSWDYIYDGGLDGVKGVGAFAITYNLSVYLHAVNDNNPDLIKYFRDTTEYTIGSSYHPDGGIDDEHPTWGDRLMEKIGEAEYDKLVAFEIKYAMEDFNSSATERYLEQDFSSPSDAAYWWMDQWENPGYRNPEDREREAEKIYDEFKDFKCSSSSSSSSSSGSSSVGGTSDAEITLIGDSISVMAEQELRSKFPSGYLTMVGSRHPTSGGACAGDKGGLEILQKLASGSGTILTQQYNKSSCDSLEIDGNSLKKNVVWELGTNTTGATKETMEEVVELVGGDRKLFLVTPYNGDSRYKANAESIANMYREIAEEHDNVYIVDWANAVKDSENTYVYKESYATVHPTDEGKELLAKLIDEAISGSDSCTTYEGEYPEYIQSDSAWGDMSYGPGCTMASCGCGAASMAMLATVATGDDIFPNDIADLLGDKWYWSTPVTTNDPIVGEHYGFEVKTDESSSEEETKTKFREYLNNGYMIHFTGAGCYPGFQSGSYCSPGHVVGIFSIDGNDNVMLADSAFGGNQEVSLDVVAKAKTWAQFTAIKGGSTERNACDGTACKNSSSVNLGSLTEEQAQKIADYYNSDEVTASNFIGGVIPSDYGKVNCVSFSYWFVSAFTDASDEGATTAIIGDGSYIADTGLPNSLGWETGNDPTPYSIFGGAGSSAWSHTGVVVGTTDDGDILTIEAAYGIHDARVLTKPRSYFAEGVGILAYPGEHFTPNESHLGNKSFNEIIGN